MLHEDEEDDDSTSINSYTELGGNKRKCFNILPSIFRRKHKYKNEDFENACDGKQLSFEAMDDDKLCPTFPMTDSCLIPGSPISPRVKNFNMDMKVLVLSRKDNPYLSKQIERSNSLSSEYTSQCPLSTPVLTLRKSHRSCSYYSSKQSVISDQFLSLNRQEEQTNLHDKLIRSPPPNFPEKLSHFLFTENMLDQMKDDDDDDDDD